MLQKWDYSTPVLVKIINLHQKLYLYLNKPGNLKTVIQSGPLSSLSIFVSFIVHFILLPRSFDFMWIKSISFAYLSVHQSNSCSFGNIFHVSSTDAFCSFEHFQHHGRHDRRPSRRHRGLLRRRVLRLHLAGGIGRAQPGQGLSEIRSSCCCCAAWRSWKDGRSPAARLHGDQWGRLPAGSGESCLGTHPGSWRWPGALISASALPRTRARPPWRRAGSDHTRGPLGKPQDWPQVAQPSTRARRLWVKCQNWKPWTSQTWFRSHTVAYPDITNFLSPSTAGWGPTDPDTVRATSAWATKTSLGQN